ncbi:HEAT repeat domain-containing protein [Corallococcus sp. CA053C]|uniref:HEAT repeat domain-containing protein n=1 Tax=Corallococcus sp. CA053C TaxID=2316732 RepID=UPI000EA13F2C|nr:HEAT repeat domain-containing protein [Corallococcus sp. CA053C]RKH11594.1 HEAT repeat domain-containing protein [Corallococcus sp. CA053C]
MRSLTVLLWSCGLLGAGPAHAEAPAAAATERELRTLLARCLAGTEACKELDSYATSESEDLDIVRTAVRRLTEKLGQEGGADSLPLLWQLTARGSFEVTSAREALQTRLMTQALATRPCVPPSSEEVTAERARLGDFAALRVQGGKLVALQPTQEELEDLAYFLVAVREAGPPVGETQEPGGDWRRPAPANDSLDAASAELESARLRGDLRSMDAAARRYLVLLGYPAPLKASEENAYGWHGARYESVMREWAAVQEDLGAFGEAAALYRRANPGSGACGTGWDEALKDLILGTIRTTEQHAGCLGVVAERLQDVDNYFWGVFEVPSPYGPARLREAGFDLARLYRGALVTRHRDLPPEELKRVLSAAPEPLRTDALRRLQERGPEAWEKRVRALEGFADVGQRDALEPLLALALGSQGETQHRAVVALGTLTARPEKDPCAKNEFLGGERYGSEKRYIHMLGEQCATALNPGERDAIATRLLPLLKSKDGWTREVTVKALGRLGSPLAVPRLRQLSRDPYTRGGYFSKDHTRTFPHYPVREAAAEALKQLP